MVDPIPPGFPLFPDVATYPAANPPIQRLEVALPRREMEVLPPPHRGRVQFVQYPLETDAPVAFGDPPNRFLETLHRDGGDVNDRRPLPMNESHPQELAILARRDPGLGDVD